MGLDLQEVPRQDSTCSTHALDHGAAQRRVGFFPQVDSEQLRLCVPTYPWVSAGMNIY